MANSTKSVKNLATDTSRLLSELDKLSVERQEFEKNDYSRTNKALYEILGKVYLRYREASASNEVLRQTVKSLREILTARGCEVQKNSIALGLFVRYVFNVNRQRVHVYTRALMAAKVAEVEPENFAGFVEEEGGLEKCKVRLPPSPKFQEKQKQIAEVMPRVEELLSKTGEQVLAEFTVDARMLEAVKEHGVVFLVGTCDDKGTVKVRTVIPGFSKGYEKWAKSKLAQYLNEHKTEATSNAAPEVVGIEQAIAALEKAGAKTKGS